MLDSVSPYLIANSPGRGRVNSSVPIFSKERDYKPVDELFRFRSLVQKMAVGHNVEKELEEIQSKAANQLSIGLRAIDRYGTRLSWVDSSVTNSEQKNLLLRTFASLSLVFLEHDLLSEANTEAPILVHHLKSTVDMMKQKIDGFGHISLPIVLLANFWVRYAKEDLLFDKIRESFKTVPLKFHELVGDLKYEMTAARLVHGAQHIDIHSPADNDFDVRSYHQHFAFLTKALKDNDFPRYPVALYQDLKKMVSYAVVRWLFLQQQYHRGFLKDHPLHDFARVNKYTLLKTLDSVRLQQVKDKVGVRIWQFPARLMSEWPNDIGLTMDEAMIRPYKSEQHMDLLSQFTRELVPQDYLDYCCYDPTRKYLQAL